MAIQNRRGDYKDFDPYKMVPGEFAIVMSGDPNSKDGTSVYHCFAPGVVKRLASYEDLSDYAKKATTLSGYGITDGATKEQFNQLSQEKADKNYVVSVFEQLKQLIQNGEIESAVAVLDEAILDLSTLA